MSAERLREAAKLLRERAEAASVEAEPPWSMLGQWIESFNGTEIPTSPDNNGNEADGVSVYIATMHPGVGLALADWLDAQHRHVTRHECEAQCEYPDGCDQTRIAYRIVDLILGDAS